MLLGFLGSLAWAFDGASLSLGRIGETGQVNRIGPTNVLSSAELECLRLAVLSNKQIAERLTLSIHSVKDRFDSILYKLGAASRSEAMVIGLRRGVVVVSDLETRGGDSRIRRVPTRSGRIESLTVTEATYLRLTALPQKQAADRMGVGVSGAKFNFTSLSRKLGVSSRGEGMVVGLRHGLVSLQELVVSSDPITMGPVRLVRRASRVEARVEASYV